MVEPVIAHPPKINVVSQANSEIVTHGHGRNLDEGDPGIQDPLPQHHDVKIECRDVRVFERLAG